MSVAKVVHPSGVESWQARWRDPSGRQRSKNFPTRAKAEKFERNIRADLDRGEYRPPAASRYTVETWAKAWLDGALNLRDGGRDLYRRDLDGYILPALGHVRLDRLSPADIRGFLAGQLAQGRAPASVHRYWRTLRRLLNVAVRDDVLLRSPMAAGKVQAPHVPKVEMRYLDAGRLEALARAAGVNDGCRACNPPEGKPRRPCVTHLRYEAMTLVWGWGALRWGEVAGLRHSAVDRKRGGIRIVTQWTGTKFEETKGSNLRFVSLPASVMDVIPRGRGDSLVFTAPRGGPLVHSNWRQRVWVPAKERAGVDPDLRPHDLRHTGAAIAIAEGIHPEELRKRMGHSSIAVTFSHYGHLLPGAEEAFAVKLDEARARARQLRAV
jgi:integrase